MFDTMTLTKITGALCGALLIYLLGAWAAEELYHVGGGHGDEEHAAGYVIEVEEAPVGGAVEEGPSFAELLAVADVDKGAKVFGKCRACHKLEDGANGTGPHLAGIVDRAVSAANGFKYSGALVSVAESWSAENLDGFLASPKSFAPGTAMSFSGLKKPADRANLIAYLQAQ